MDDILKELSLHRLSRAREVREEAESQMDAADDMLEQTERYLKGKGIL